VNLTVRSIGHSEHHAWDDYVHAHPDATIYHLTGWRKVIEKTYGHQSYYLAAIETFADPCPVNAGRTGTRIVGILPLIQLKSLVFGNNLFSLPFFDMGGVLADNPEAASELIAEAVRLGLELKADSIELRQTGHPGWLDSVKTSCESCREPALQLQSHKVRMLLDLPEDADILMSAFKAKLRSQIRRPMKAGLTARIGSHELLSDFYRVFAENMRDLGSPVHSTGLMRNVLKEFSSDARLMVVYNGHSPVAASMVIGFRQILQNPWASALRKYSRMSPNMLLYWSMLSYGCDEGYRQFDFGRSTPGEGTYRFKAQWGAQPRSLIWVSFKLKKQAPATAGVQKDKFDKAIQYWQKMPLLLTKIIGPMIRKNIGL
jgi:serine/alanine adding enzyme